MSRVYLLAADQPLPAHVQKRFQAAPLEYYRNAVDDLGYPMKAFRYELSELSLEKDACFLRDFRACLEENFSHGGRVELWSVWVGGVNQKCPPRFQGRLADFDQETLKQFLDAKEICLTITI